MKKYYSGFFLIVLSAFFLAGVASAATVGVRDVDTGASEIWVQPGDLFEVELFIDFEVNELPVLAEYGVTGVTVDIVWDSLVDYISSSAPNYTFADVLDSRDAVGKVKFQAYNFGAPITTSHTIASLDVRCLGPGDTVLMASPGLVVDKETGNFGAGIVFLEHELASALSMDLSQTIIYEGLLIHQTPIPSTILLLGGGICALLGSGRRKNRR
jgi:hypothetical protein